MKRFLFFLSVIMVTLSSHAQVVADGYYRVQNTGSKRYAYLCDNTGFINYTTQNADVGALQLWSDIARTYDDPASVMYLTNVAEDHYDIQAQGSGLYQIIGHSVTVSKQGDNRFLVYASQNGITKYLSDNKTTDDAEGLAGFEGKGQYRLWSVFPINQTDNYLGITPQFHVDGKHYAAYYVSFPFKKVSSGLKVYYIKKVDTTYGVAIMEEVTSDIIPAGMPVIVECPSTYASGNKIIPVTGGASAPTDNLLGGVYFCNPDRPSSANAGVPFKVATMRTLGVRADGKIGFISKPDNLTKVEVNFKEYNCLPANSSYLQVASGTAAELLMMTQSEFETYLDQLVKVSSITLDKTTATLVVGDELDLTVTVKPDDAVNKNVTWTSSNAAVATVENGKVVAKGEGKAVITVATTDGSNLKATCTVTVNAEVQLATGIELDQTSAKLNVGEQLQLTATVTPDNANNKKVTWKSSDEKVATVKDGVVVAVAPGTATITATTADGSNLSATCAVKVNPILATSIKLSQTTASMFVGGNLQLTAFVQPENTSNKQVTWKSSDENVATVEDGKVVAIAEGKATITATTVDGSNLSATCTVTVTPQFATGITLNKTTATLTVGEKVQLTANVQPNNVTNKKVNWKSSDDAIATVTDGMVVAIAPGTVKITATTADGSNLSATCEVTVKPLLAKAIILSQLSATLMIGEEVQLTANVQPENVTNKEVTWKSSDENVATVEDGKVVAIAEGKATITATTVDGSNLSATCTVTVTPLLASGITLDKTEVTLTVGEDSLLTATVEPENASNKKVKWSSNNLKVATVTDEGRVTAVGVGQAVITATTADSSNLSATCTVTVKPVLATSLKLSQESLGLAVNSMFQLTATLEPENATIKDVKWSTSDTTIVTVDDKGRLKALKEGEATITVTTIDGSNLEASCKVTVRPLNVMAEKITIYANDVSTDSTAVLLGGELQLTAKIEPKDVSTTAVLWRSTDKSIATVSTNGLVRAIALGEVKIIATTVDGSEKSDTCVVTVKPILVDSIKISQAEAEMLIGETLSLTATILPKNATNKEVTWSSSDETVATVEDGKVVAIGEGKAIIKVKAADASEKYDSCTVTVKPVLADSIVLSQTEVEIAIDSELQLTAVIYPENVTKKDVVWESSDTTVVKVDNGLLKALKEGDAVITVAIADSLEIKASCAVKVIPQLATSLELEPSLVNIFVGDTCEVKAIVLPENTSKKEIEWSFDNEDVITFAKDKEGNIISGKFIGVGVGMVVITATTTDGSNLSATCTVTVDPVMAEWLSFYEEEKDSAGNVVKDEEGNIVKVEVKEVEMKVNDHYQLNPWFKPENTTNKDLFWVSFKERVAKVNQDGYVEAVSVGEAKIMATTLDGTGISAICVIKVKDGDGILSLDADQEGMEFFTIDGRKRATLQRGVNIVRMADGTVRKVFVR